MLSFSTIQKFRPVTGCVFPEITDRSNVIVMVDEVHRTQYGFDAKMTKQGDVKHGLAYQLRKPCRMPSMLPSQARRLNWLARTHAVFSGTILTFMTSLRRSRTGPRCPSIMRPGLRRSSSAKTSSAISREVRRDNRRAGGRRSQSCGQKMVAGRGARRRRQPA